MYHAKRLHPSNPKRFAAVSAAVFHQESGFNPTVDINTPNDCCRGLGQLSPRIVKHYKVRDVYNASENLRGSMEYLADALRSWGGDYRVAVANYHGGPTCASKLKYQGDTPGCHDGLIKTSDHVRVVMSKANRYEQLI